MWLDPFTGTTLELELAENMRAWKQLLQDSESRSMILSFG